MPALPNSRAEEGEIIVAETDARNAFLRESPLFSDLGTDEINRLVELSEIQEYRTGDTIVTEGSMGDAIFLLYDGELSVHTKDEGGRDIMLAQVHSRGAFLGEVALADNTSARENRTLNASPSGASGSPSASCPPPGSSSRSVTGDGTAAGRPRSMAPSHCCSKTSS